MKMYVVVFSSKNILYSETDFSRATGSRVSGLNLRLEVKSDVSVCCKWPLVSKSYSATFAKKGQLRGPVTVILGHFSVCEAVAASVLRLRS